MMHRLRTPPAAVRVLLLILVGALLGADDGDKHESDNAHEPDHEAEEVVLSPDRARALGIETARVGPGRVDSGIELLGEVRPNGDRVAHIVPRFPGIVREVRRSAGDSVQVGDVLAIIESSDSLAPYELKTLTDGIVLTKHLTRGEAVDRGKDAFVVADLSNVWVELSVYQKDLADVSVGQEVRIHAVQGGPDAQGKISYLTPAVDQATRTAIARVVLPNSERKWLPGMFVTAHTVDSHEAPIVVPQSAIQSIEGRPSVFVQVSDGFSPRPVVLGAQGSTLAAVVDGLVAGEFVAAKNSFLLKAELGKGEAEHDH